MTMETSRIGDAAGWVWQTLRENDDGCSLSELKRLIEDFTADEIVAGVGWLAREGKLSFESRGKKTVVGLVEAELCV